MNLSKEKILMAAMKAFGQWIGRGGNVQSLPADLRSDMGLAMGQVMFENSSDEPETDRKPGPRKARRGKKRAAGLKSGKKRRGGGRKPMSAQERKEVSERMRRYWAARRKEKE